MSLENKLINKPSLPEDGHRTSVCDCTIIFAKPDTVCVTAAALCIFCWHSADFRIWLYYLVFHLFLLLTLFLVCVYLVVECVKDVNIFFMVLYSQYLSGCLNNFYGYLFLIKNLYISFMVHIPSKGSLHISYSGIFL